MTCTLMTRGETSAAVIAAVEAATGFSGVQETTRINRDLGLDPPAARTKLYRPVANAIVASGCSARQFNRDHVQAATRVRDIVDKAWASVRKGHEKADHEKAVSNAAVALEEARATLKAARAELSELNARQREEAAAEALEALANARKAKDSASGETS